MANLLRVLLSLSLAKSGYCWFLTYLRISWYQGFLFGSSWMQAQWACDSRTSNLTSWASALTWWPKLPTHLLGNFPHEVSAWRWCLRTVQLASLWTLDTVLTWSLWSPIHRLTGIWPKLNLRIPSNSWSSFQLRPTNLAHMLRTLPRCWYSQNLTWL